MKKYLRKILCGLVSVAMLISGITAFAQTPMQMEWYGDYSDNSNPKLIVTFKPSAKYTQQVITVAYPTAVTNPTLSDYVRMEEVAVKEGKKTDVVFNITNAFSATGGAYTVEVQGNGHLHEVSNDKVDVFVIKQGDIAGLLTEFNSATEANFATVLGKVIPALQLSDEADADRKAKRIRAMIGIRTSDFGGAFSNLENVRDAWHTSDILVYIGQADATVAGVKQRILANAQLLGIDTNDADFVAHTDEMCQDLLTYDSEYNNNAGIQSLSDLKDAIGEALGTIAVNNATELNMPAVFSKYKSYFNISSSALADYNSLSDTYKSKALRDLYQKNFNKASELVTAFEGAVTTIKSEEESGTQTPPVVIIPPTGGGNTGGSALSGAPSAPATTPTPTATPNFKDVPASHWAYSYVTELAKKNIIGGYDDNTFKPNNNVTREEFVKMIIGAVGLVSLDKSCEFTDVPESAWYYDYVASAYNAGIVSGVSDTVFGVGANITRQDVAVIAARVLSYLGKTPTATAETTLTDIDTVADYATDSVKLLNGIGIINGYDDGSFMPNNTLTRAEAATIICKLINSL